MKHFQQKEDNCVLQGWASTAVRHHFEAEDARSNVEEARKQVGPPESRLKWIEQQLSALLAECAVSTIEVSTSNPLEDQAMPPKRASKSSQTTLKDLRSTLRGDQKPDENKKCAWSYSFIKNIKSRRKEDTPAPTTVKDHRRA